MKELARTGRNGSDAVQLEIEVSRHGGERREETAGARGWEPPAERDGGRSESRQTGTEDGEAHNYLTFMLVNRQLDQTTAGLIGLSVE